ncbi:Z-ring formation inhibitor MciZ [Paenibacillus ferrarius]|uniref:Z-ring formation inhibitor MciZ n=1 Tax=Paenibacillus ferrarius TaxID=1469647 RepID=UPI003D26F5AC
MKSYIGDGQIRIVGKAWEVKHQLHKMMRQAGEGATVAEYIGALHRGSSSGRSGSAGRTLPFPVR